MKVLVISSWFPYPPVHGSKLRAYHLLRELAKRHAVTLLSFAEPGEEKHVDHMLEICESVHVVPGNPFKAIRALSRRELFSPIPRSYRQTFSPAMQSLVDGMISSHDAAIGFQLGAALYLDRGSAIPRIFEEAEVTVIRERYASERHPLKRLRRGLTWWKLARYMRTLCDRFDQTTVVSEVERRHLASVGCDPQKVTVIPNGVDAAKLNAQTTPQAATLIYPGALTYQANYDAVRFFLAEIFPIIRQARPEVGLKVTGSVDGVDLGSLPSRECVTFTGHVEDIQTLIAQSRVCVVPLQIGGGTRLKVIEAMALGTPVVSTPKGAEGLLVTSEENVLIGKTPRQFADQVLRLLNDDALCTRLSANARRLVAQRYTWDRIGVDLDALLTKTVDLHQARLQHHTVRHSRRLHGVKP